MSLIIIISSPSGGGKTTIIKKLLKNKNYNRKLSVSITTRSKREGEVNAVDYHFKTKKEFSLMEQNNELLEYTKIYGNYYGTSLSVIKDNLDRDSDIIFDIDYLGKKQICDKIDERQIISIFILPPSIEILQKRLIDRGTDDKKTINLRLQAARNEIANASFYDHQIVNDNLEEVIVQIEKLITEKKTYYDRSNSKKSSIF